MLDAKAGVIALMFLMVLVAALETRQSERDLVHLLAAEHRAVELYIANWLPRHADSLYQGAATPHAISWTNLQSQGAVPAHYTGENRMGQEWELLVRQAGPNRLEALLSTQGGRPLPARKLPEIAALLEYGAYVGLNAAPGTARGVAGSSEIDLQPWLDAGIAVEEGRVVSLIAFDEGRLVTDYLSRVPILGADRANRMFSHLDMGANDLHRAGLVEVEQGLRIGPTAAAGASCDSAGTITGWNNASGRGLICVLEGASPVWRAVATVPTCSSGQFLRGDGERLSCANPPW